MHEKAIQEATLYAASQRHGMLQTITKTLLQVEASLADLLRMAEDTKKCSLEETQHLGRIESLRHKYETLQLNKQLLEAPLQTMSNL